MMRFTYLVIALLALLSFAYAAPNFSEKEVGDTIGAIQTFEAPSKISINYTDIDVNQRQSFNIKTDKQTYSGFIEKTVYLEITNLLGVGQQGDIILYFDTEVSRINFFEWDSSRWQEQTTGFTKERPPLVPGNFTDGRVGAKAVSFAPGETKTFVLSFVPTNMSGEFYACIANDCLDPWWDTAWANKAAIQFTLITEESDNNIIALRNIDLSPYGIVCSDLQDVRVVDENVLVDLNRLIEGTASSVDANIYVELENRFPIGTYNTTLYLYFGNADCTEPNIDIGTIWEDYTSVADWTQVSVAGGSATLQTLIAREGNAWRFTSDGADDDAAISFFRANTTKDMSFYIRANQVVTAGYQVFQFTNNAGGATFFQGEYKNVGLTAGGTLVGAATLDDKWFKIRIRQISGTTAKWWLFDSNGVQVGRLDNKSTGGNPWTAPFRFYNMDFDSNNSVRNVYYDTISNFEVSSAEPALTMGSIESQADLNFWRVDGFDPTSTPFPAFSFPYDGNIAIDFNVYSADNNRFGFIDLYYSPTTASTDGTAIITDLNLSVDVCSDLDWDDTPSSCSWPWDFEDVADGNYYIIVDFNATQSASSTTLAIANDVNLQISFPKDEETGAVLSSSAYYYTVRITWDDNSFFYNHLSDDLNTFAVPKDKTVFIEIDVNGSDYYSRTYAKKYGKSTVTDTLQAYLVQQANGIETVFFTKDAYDASTVSGITIKTFRTVIGAGYIEIGSTVTDDAGTSLMSFIYDEPYDFFFYSADGNLLFQKSIKPISTTYYVYIQTGEVTSSPEVTQGFITIRGIPNADLVTYTPGVGYDINIFVDINGDTLSTVTMAIYNDSGLYVSKSCYFDCNHTIPPGDLNTTYSMRVVIFAKAVSGLTREVSWEFIPYDLAGENFLATLASPELRMSFGCSADKSEPCFIALMLAAIITTAAVFAVGAGVTQDRSALGIVAVMFLAIFTFIEWVPPEFVILAAIAVFASLVLSRRNM